MLCELVQYKELKDIGLDKAAKLSNIDISKITKYEVEKYAKQNKDISKLFGMIRYTENRKRTLEVTENTLISEFNIADHGRPGRNGTWVSSTENNKKYKFIVREGFKIIRV